MPDMGFFPDSLNDPSELQGIVQKDSSTPASGSALSKAAGGLGAIGHVIGGVGDILGGINQESAYRQQAVRYEQQAKLDLYYGGQEVQQIGNKAQMTLSSEAAASGASGVTEGGSPAALARESISNANMASAAARFSAKVQNTEDLYEASVQNYSGKQAMMAGLMGGITQFAKAGESFATGGLTDMMPSS